MAFYATDGRQVKTLTVDSVLGAGYESVLFDGAAAPREYDKIVPFVRRAVRLRCNGVAGVPVTLQKGDTDVSTRKEWSGLMGQLQSLIYRTELALCLAPQGAYWRRTANGLGLNPTPEWLLPLAVWPFITAERGLATFRYTHPWGVPEAGRVEYLAPDEVVHIWYPSIDRASWPGTPPGITAMAAAGVLANADAFVAQYFARGAVKSLLLQVPSNTRQDERDKLKSWWGQIVAGVRSAWKANVISADITPITLGEGLADLASDKLAQQYRQDVAAAFDIPETMLMQGAANYATAMADRISFYQETVFPELGLILEAVNRQWLLPDYGVRLVAHPEQTEAAQDQQVQQAAAVTELVGAPVLTVDEGRAWLGLGPLPDDAAPGDTAEEDADYATMDAEAQADAEAEDRAEQDAVGAPVHSKQILGYHIETGVVSRNEARAALGLPPEDETADQQLRRLQSQLSVAQAAISAGYPPADAQRMVGLPPVAPEPTDAGDAPPMKALPRLPGTAERQVERSVLWGQQAQARKTLRQRHEAERLGARKSLIDARLGAPTARERLRLVHRQRAELGTLADRQRAERAMLRGLHAAERGRVRDRHAAQRGAEVAALAPQEVA